MIEARSVFMPPVSLRIGDKLKDFSLRGVDGQTYSFKDFSTRSILVIVFLSNTSNYSKAYESRLVNMQNHFEHYSVQFIAINANDPLYSVYESYYKLVEQARRNCFNFPYLKDADQSVAKYFDVICTPEAFVFDKQRRLVYRGRIDDNWSNPKAVRTNYVVKAINQILKNKPISISETVPLGDSVKWRY